MSCFRTACRVAAGIYFVVVLLAVLWDSGSEIAELKESVGPWFLNAEGKDIILNLVMLAPLTLLAHLGWPRTAWWHWALAGCAPSPTSPRRSRSAAVRATSRTCLSWSA